MFLLTKSVLILSMLSLSLGSIIDFKGFVGETRNFTNVLSTCDTIQAYERRFTGASTCKLSLNNLAGNIEVMRGYVNNQSSTLSIADLLAQAFDNSTFFFQNNYTYFNTQYKDFEGRIIAIMDKIKVSTNNSLMGEFRDAALASNMDVVFKNITAPPLPSTCPKDSSICERTNSLFDIDLQVLPTLTVTKFLKVFSENLFRQFQKQFTPVGLEESTDAMNNLLEALEFSGTAKSNTGLVQALFNTQIFDNFKYYYSNGYTEPTVRKTRTTTFKPTKTAGEKVTKVKPQQYVTIEVYLSVPLVILFIGIVFTLIVIVFYYRMKPHVGGTAKMAPTTTPVATIQHKSSKF